MEKLNMKRRKGEWAQAGWDDRIFLVVVYTVLILVTFCCLYPMYFTVIASFSDPGAVYTGKVNLWPVGFSTEAYKLVFNDSRIWRGYANSIYYTVVGTLFNLLLTIPGAYALSKRRMYGRSILTTIFIFTMYFGGGMIPYYILLKNMHLLNTRWVLIIGGGVSVYNMVVTRTYFQNNVPESLCEAARIDGASEFGTFLRVVLPISGPIVAVMALYYAVSHWSSYFAGMVYVTDPDIQPLQVVLRKILILNETAYADAMESGDAALIINAEKRAQVVAAMKYSVVFIASLPMLILYPFIQKHFVRGIMVGSLKG